MTEKRVKESLDFLCHEYDMKYNFIKVETKHGNMYGATEAYSYHNKYGCFTIANFYARGEIDYIRLDNIDSLKDFLCSKSPKYSLDNEESIKEYEQYIDKRTKHKINIYEEEPEVWGKHEKLLFFKNPFFWEGSKKELRALADVIKTQIKKQSRFFNIKI